LNWGIAAILTLTLAIGGNAAVFTRLHAVLLGTVRRSAKASAERLAPAEPKEIRSLRALCSLWLLSLAR